jgi:flagellar protein FliT
MEAGRTGQSSKTIRSAWANLMSLVQQIYEVTSKLYELLQIVITDQNHRDKVINEVENLLEIRQQLLSDLKGPFSEEEKELGQQIIEFNKVIDEKLDQLKLDVQTDMNKVKKQKTSNEKYVNPYKNVSFDGMFFDKKK